MSLRQHLSRHRQLSFETLGTLFDGLAPSRQTEIVRYIDGLKTDASVDRNAARARDFLLGKTRFVGRDRP